jgi:lipocalin
LIAIFSFLVTIHLASCQIQGLGPCPTVEVVKNFDVKKYTGLWYEVQKYPNFFSRGAKCITANYQLKADGTVSVNNQQIKNGANDTILGVARVISSGILGVSFPTVPCKH